MKSVKSIGVYRPENWFDKYAVGEIYPMGRKLIKDISVDGGTVHIKYETESGEPGGVIFNGFPYTAGY